MIQNLSAPSAADVTSLLDPDLWPIYDKLMSGIRFTYEDGVRMFETADLLGLGMLANIARESKTGNDAYFIVNQHINYSNMCVYDCAFCAFGARPKEPHAYEYSIDEIIEKGKTGAATGAREFHIVGGLHPKLGLEWYCEMLRELKTHFPKIHLKGFTAVEIDFFSRKEKISIRETLQRLMEAGLDSMPGGGAEIFSEEIHEQICKPKIGWTGWSNVHRTAHSLGLRSNATMLYGHIETAGHRVDHMLRLRELQDETGGFMTFIPLAFHPDNTQLEHIRKASGETDLRCIAVGRLMLDNFDHIKAYWTMLGLKIAQTALQFGADDFDGTVTEEKITHFAGAETPQILSAEEIIRLIEETGHRPVERDTTFETFIPRTLAETA